MAGFERFVNPALALALPPQEAGLAETLSSDPRLRITPANAVRLVGDLAKALNVRAMVGADYQHLITSAPAQGIRGGMICDVLHVQTARLCGCAEVHTVNVAHFKVVAPDLTVRGL